jgi:hypothetical protein
MLTRHSIISPSIEYQPIARRRVAVGIIDLIRQEVADGLIVLVRDMQSLSTENAGENQTALKIGDEIEFELAVRNDSPFALRDLDFRIHQMRAVQFEESPVECRIDNLSPGEEKRISAMRGMIKENPDDVTSPWMILDSLCRTTIAGEIEIPPLQFHDEELEMVNVLD